MIRLIRTVMGQGLDFLVCADADLDRLYCRYGAPVLCRRQPNFACLVHAILEQQVSLASARVVYGRIEDAVSELTPEAFLGLGEELQTIGVVG